MQIVVDSKGSIQLRGRRAVEGYHQDSTPVTLKLYGSRFAGVNNCFPIS